LVEGLSEGCDLKITGRSLRATTFYTSLTLLSRNDRHKIFAVALIQVLLGFLDLAGVAAMGALGSLAVTGIQSKNPGDRVSSVLELLKIDGLTFQAQVSILGAVAVGLLLGRTVLTIFFTRRTLFFLANRGSKASADLISKVLAQPLMDIRRKTSQETLWSVTNGVATIMLGVLGVGINMVSDISMLLVICIGLFVIDPVMALGMIIVFGAAGLALFFLLHQRARKLGSMNTRLSIASNEKILEILQTYREAVVRNRREYYSREIAQIRFQLGDVLAENAFMPYIGKYVIESTVIIGALGLSAYQFITNDASHAVATMVVFMAAGTRIGPAVLRIQQGSITVKGSLSTAQPTLDLVKSVRNIQPLSSSSDLPNFTHESFQANISIRNVDFRYPGSPTNALSKVDMDFQHGSIAALVGSSGAGKTTLVDILLGIIEPDHGEVLICHESPKVAVEKWPGAIAYVPQDVAIISGSIKSNVALGFSEFNVSDEDVWLALELAQLAEFVRNLPSGIKTEVGERGTKLSGGQRQRLGIARAMFTKPRLLILDEATSALDGETESNIASAITSLRGEVTVITIAHRLSTIRDADKVVYMENGEVKSIGTFDEVRQINQNFDAQARLMGL
jgi:ABC-type multidrug transport system fused ATPase/permease subunit